MTTDQVPSVGRVVHYVSHGTPVRPDGTQAFQSRCRAALVTEVPFEASADGKIGLCVLNPSGMFFQQDCPYAELTGDGVPPGGSWHWPERV